MEQKTSGFAVVGDNPITLPPRKERTREDLVKADHLGYTHFVAPFAERLLASRRNTPFTVGVYAPWGQGKSSLMRILQGYLEEDATVATVWFDPWKYHSREEAWRGLALTLVHAVRQNDTLRKEINRKLPGLKGWAARVLWSGLAGKFGEELIHEIKSEPWNPAHLHLFEQTLDQLFDLLKPEKREGRPEEPLLVLFVDDLDRCLSEPAAAVLEALKLVLDKPGIVTVMGIDRHELALTLERLYRPRRAEGAAPAETAAPLPKEGEWGTRYLAKIIQVPFEVPAVSDGHFEQYVLHCLKQGGLSTALDRPERWAPLVRSACGTNLREVKRFVNGFVAEWDKASASVAINRAQVEAWSLEIDAPHVAFMLLLDKRAPDLLRHCRGRGERDAETFLTLQRQMLAEKAEPREGAEAKRLPEEEAALSRWLKDPVVEKLFRDCMGASPPLVAPFEAPYQVGVYLNLGRRTLEETGARESEVEAEAVMGGTAPAETFAAADKVEVEVKRGKGTKKHTPVRTAFDDARALIRNGALKEARSWLEGAWGGAMGPEGQAEAAALLAEVEILAGRPEEGAQQFRARAEKLPPETVRPHARRLAEELGDLLGKPETFKGDPKLREEAGRALAGLGDPRPGVGCRRDGRERPAAARLRLGGAAGVQIHLPEGRRGRAGGGGGAARRRPLPGDPRPVPGIPG